MVAPALLALALGALGVVAVPPEGPLVSLSASDAVVRMPFKVTCSIKRAVPATNVTITANNLTWPVTLSQDGHQATAEVTVQNKGNVQLGCTVHMGSRKLQTNATVQVFYVPVPLLNVTNTAKAGTELRGQCSLPPGAVSDIQVKVATNHSVLVDFKKPPVTFSLMVTEEDAEKGLVVTCEAKMHPDPPRNKSQVVHVLVKPRLDMELCPPQQNWTEGQDGILNCSAKGTPKPQVNCSKDGIFLTPGKSHPINRAHAGTYLCRATNDLGTAERNVTVWVQYDASVPLLPLLLGTLLPAVVVFLTLAVGYLLHRQGKIGEYRLWKRHPRPDAQPLRPRGGSAAAPNGSAAP
ncbi:intercellular adhesion molecule 1-like isoform X2 [Zonotrichia albicollis]|uniref:intercellular adhesion molecule 1-like isoform X2 n=1 Tax=Zonotrichia albicollis TaxID=44394 RepID=UPI003D80F8F4